MKSKHGIALILVIFVSACATSAPSSIAYKPIVLTDQTITCAAEPDLLQIRDHNDTWLCENKGKNCPKKKLW